MAGRKSLKEEIRIVERLAELSEPTFKFIQSCLLREAVEADSDETRRNIRADKKWAIEQMTKLYAKCIPTEVTGEGGGAVIIAFDESFKKLREQDEAAITPEAKEGGGESSQV